MNTTEKRKLEGVITSKLSEVREAYQSRRKRELEALAVQQKNNPPVLVKKLITNRTGVIKDFDKQLKAKNKEIESIKSEYDKILKQRDITVQQSDKKLLAHGFSISSLHYNDGEIQLCSEMDYTSRIAVRTYTSPILTAHSKETQDRVQGIDNLSTAYTLKVWAENGEMAELLESFQDEVASLTK